MTTEAPSNAAPNGHIRLADFIRSNIEPIVVEWIAFAQTRTPASDGMTKLALRDHIEEILNFVADDIESHQTKNEQVEKSRGLAPDNSKLAQSAAQVHAALRLSDGFDIDQMVSEYRALRASVVKQWIAVNQFVSITDLEELTRFHEAIDQALAESVAHYTNSINHSRNLFLGVLGHDLRNPIGAVTMAARRLAKQDRPDPQQSFITGQIVAMTERATRILNDLLDVTRSAFGTSLPVVRAPMEMRFLARQIVEEMRLLAPDRTIEINIVGDTAGEWDNSRVGQMLSNLIGNALQYSPENSPVLVNVAAQGDDLYISVHNAGDPIPSSKLNTIFDSLVRGLHGEEEQVGAMNLGLGLFIAKRLAVAHQGDISVASTADAGTTFTVRLPRY